jgi:biopolymer transport protein ExbD
VAGQIIVSGNMLSLAQLVTIVNSELKNAGNEPSRVSVVLRADRRGNCRTVNEVVSLLERLDIRSVRIAVESGA